MLPQDSRAKRHERRTTAAQNGECHHHPGANSDDMRYASSLPAVQQRREPHYSSVIPHEPAFSCDVVVRSQPAEPRMDQRPGSTCICNPQAHSICAKPRGRGLGLRRSSCVSLEPRHAPFLALGGNGQLLICGKGSIVGEESISPGNSRIQSGQTPEYFIH